MLSGAKAGPSLLTGSHIIALSQQGALRGGTKAVTEVRLGMGRNIQQSLRVFRACRLWDSLWKKKLWMRTDGHLGTQSMQK